MKTRACVVVAMAVLVVLVVAGCGQKASETKPMDQVRSEAEKMDKNQLRAIALDYQSAIQAKAKELAQLTQEAATKAMSGDTASLKEKMDKLGASVNALKERLQVYLDELKKKGGDLTGL